MNIQKLAVLSIVFVSVIYLRIPVLQASSGSPDQLTEAATQLQVIDAQYFKPTAIPSLADPLTPPPCYGCVTDGTSLLVLRLNPMVYASAVTFVLSSTSFLPIYENAEHIGSIWTTFPSLPAPNSGTTFGQTSATIAAGQTAAVIYRPPARFLWRDKIGYQAAITVTVTAYLGGKQLAQTTFTLETPDQLLMHGILSSKTAMTSLKNYLGGPNGVGVMVVPIDWSGQNSSGFGAATPVVVTGILNDIGLSRKVADCAETRVDIAGHSMGGMLAVWYAMNLGNITLFRPASSGFTSGVWYGAKFPFIRDNNFGQGDFRRIVTIDSPFEGSPVAVQLESLGLNLPLKTLILQQGGSGDFNCFYDLASGSEVQILFSNTSA